MAERQGYENNDFTGGITDEYVPTKDNRLDAAANICLDDDLTPIQRPGSGKLTGSDNQFGKNANQTTSVIGLLNTPTKLRAFSPNYSFLYENGPSFTQQLLPQSRTNDIFVEPTGYTELTLFGSNPTFTPKSSGSINGFSAREIIYATNSSVAFPHKFLRTSTNLTGDTTNICIPVGLPKIHDLLQTKDSDGNKISLTTNSKIFARFILAQRTGGTNNNLTYIQEALPTVPNYTVAVSDLPYLYTVNSSGQIVPDTVNTYTYKYLISFTLKAEYVIDGVKYIKESAPTTPIYFLTNVNLKNPADADKPHLLHVRLGLEPILPLMNQMNVPYFQPIFDGTGITTNGVSLYVETYMSESPGTVLKKVNKYRLNSGQNDSNFVFYPDSLTAFNNSRYLSPLTSATDIHLPLALYSTPEEDRIPLYTTGGVLAYSPPPPCRYIAEVGDYAYYANIKEMLYYNPKPTGSGWEFKFQSVPYRLKQSNVLDPDSVPEGNYIDFPDEITGVGAVLDRCIVGTTKEIYRVDGRFDDLGAGLVNTQLLSAETGCIAHRSMVAVKDKLFFCGDDGIYVTDGVYVACISRHITRTYRSLVASIQTDTTGDILALNTTNQDKISATYDRAFDRVLFSFGNKILALELKASQIEASYGSFFGPWFTGLNESSPPNSFVTIGQFKNSIVRGDQYGYVYQFSPGYLSDPKTSGDFTPPWDRLPIIYRLRTMKLAFGSLVVKKWVSILTFILKRRKVLSGGETNIDVQINAYNDGERIRQKLKPVHYNGSKDCVYDEDPKTGAISVPKFITDTLVNIQRRFGSSGLRCLTKAVEFTNGLYLVAKSDSYELGVTGGPGNIYISMPTMSWPNEPQDTNPKGYYICLDNDNYYKKYLVAGQNGVQTLVLSEAAPAGSHKWKLYSFSTDQFFGLHSLGMVYSSFGSKHDAYVLADQGGNVGDAGE